MMNIQKMMKQAQQMQTKMMQLQEEMAQREFEGKAGGGMVVATVSGKGSMVKISIDDSLMAKEEKDMLEDLIVAAFNDAKKRADDAMQESVGALTGGLGLPADFKLPF
ncbi:MAG: YbaB/EbfC family nucleoid-associated protein [Alphaproteobacteria bacterium]|nr:MAG: YbaB/EbfC family nucleoid-associated protein [Alphaproteobacteria bacterium]